MALLRKAGPPGASTGFASPERATLAAEVARYTAREAELAKGRVAEPLLTEAVHDAQRRVDAATEGLAAAKADAARYLREHAQGMTATPAVTVGDARAELQAAEDAQEAAVEARAWLRERLADANRYPEQAKIRLRNAALAVIRVEAQDQARRLVAEVDRRQRELVRAGTALEWLAESGVFATQQEHGLGYGKILDPAVATTVGRIQSPSGSWNGLHQDTKLRGDGPWAAALDALQRDANAPLPT